jgi:serine/threonine protein kinase
MKNLRHNLIIRILETIETSKYILIVMENISGGDLLSFVKKRTKLSEKIAKFIFKQLITALKYIHSHNIVHRDIKLDNILIDLNNNIKLCDFGVGKQIHKGTLLKDKCGTPAYIAPEILRSEGYEGPPVDMWSSGVVLYAMLSGTVPFKPANLKELNKVIQKGEYPPIPDISKEAAHLINGLLEIDPKKRFTIEKVMNHPWLIMNSNDKSDENKLMLFTKAEMVLLSKANVDYRTSNKDEMMENFTLKNLDTNNDKCNKNVTTKSFIFAPFNSTFISISEGDNNENEISIEKSVIKFNNETQALNRIYELNYNGEIDHGVLIQHHSLSNQDEQKGNNQQQLNGGASLSLNDKHSIQWLYRLPAGASVQKIAAKHSISTSTDIDSVIRKIDSKKDTTNEDNKTPMQANRDLLEEASNIGDIKRYNMMLQNISISPNVKNYIKNNRNS